MNKIYPNYKETNNIIVNGQNDDNNNNSSDLDGSTNDNRQVFNRLYEHAMNLRIKQSLRVAAENHLSKLRASKVIDDLKERNSARMELK